MSESVRRLEAYVLTTFASEPTGHDHYHMFQVRDMALRIAETEGGDTGIIELAALAHDIGDKKFYPDRLEGEAATRAALESSGVPAETAERVMHIVGSVSFSGGKVPESLEGKIVQDADRLFALGAVGIARAFAFGGSRSRPMYDPDNKDSASTVGHFYEKLLLLKERLNTKTAAAIAEDRHAFMEEFLRRFYEEWNTKL